MPLPFDDSTLSKPRFALRHKHLLYVTHVPGDSVTDVGLSPKYEKWISHRCQLDRKQVSVPSFAGILLNFIGLLRVEGSYQTFQQGARISRRFANATVT